MKQRLLILIAQLASCVLLTAAEPLQPRQGEAPASGLYVPVSVDGHANHSAGTAFICYCSTTQLFQIPRR